VDGQGKDIVAAGQQRGGAVALMDVEIDDQDPARIALRQQPVGGNCQIVEHAIAGARLGQRMMATAGAVRGIAMLQGQPRGQPGAARRILDAAGNFCRHRKTDAALLLAGNHGGQHFLDIGGVMHRLDPRAGHRLGRVSPVPGRMLADRLHHQPIFVEDKAAARRARRDIVGMVHDMQHRCADSRPPDQLSRPGSG